MTLGLNKHVEMIETIFEGKSHAQNDLKSFEIFLKFDMIGGI